MVPGSIRKRILGFAIFCITIECVFATTAPCDISKINVPKDCTISKQNDNKIYVICKSISPELFPIVSNPEAEIDLICDHQGSLKGNLAIFNMNGIAFSVWLPERCTSATIEDSTLNIFCKNLENQEYVSRIQIPNSIFKTKNYQLALGTDAGILKFLFVPKECDASQMTFDNNLTRISCKSIHNELINNVLTTKTNNILYILQDSGLLKAMQLPSTCDFTTMNYDGDTLSIKCSDDNGNLVSNTIAITKEEISKPYILMNYKGQLMLYLCPDACQVNSAKYSNKTLYMMCHTSKDSQMQLSFKDNMVDDVSNAQLKRCDVKLVKNRLSSPCNLNVIKNFLPLKCLNPDIQDHNGHVNIICHDNENNAISSNLNITCDCLGNPHDIKEIKNIMM